MDRRQPGVAGAQAVAPVGLQVAKEAGDQVVVELAEVHLPRRDAGRLPGEGEQQAPGVPVGADRVGARVLLREQLVGEKALQDRGETAHEVSSGVP